MSDSTTSPDTSATTEAAVGAWLIERIRFYDQVDPAIVTLDAPLEDLGLDSIYVMTLCGDIEDAYGLAVDPTFFADQTSLAGVAAALSDRIGSA